MCIYVCISENDMSNIGYAYEEVDVDDAVP